MAHRCRILHNLHLLLAVLPLHRAQNRHQAVSLHHRDQHKLLLVILLVHLQINLLHKVAVVNPKQEKLKQQVIATVKQDLV
jgi:hypothetical protein